MVRNVGIKFCQFNVLTLILLSILIFSTRSSWTMEDESSQPRIRRSNTLSDSDTYKTTYLRAIKEGNLDTVKKFYLHQVVYDDRGWTPLYLATHFGHYEIAEWLLQNREDINRPNLHRFRTRSLGEKRKDLINSKDLKKSPEYTEKRAGFPIAGGIKLDDMASQKLLLIEESARKKAEHQQISSNDKRAFFMNKMQDIRDFGGVWGSHKVESATPIFAIAQKMVLSEKDLSLANLFIRAGADLDIKNTAQKTPVDILESRLKELAGDDQPSAPRVSHKTHLAKKLYDLALTDIDFRNALAAKWYLFADSKTTARIIEQDLNSQQNSLIDNGPQQDEEKNRARLAILDGLIRWDLDIYLPKPREAYDLYMRVKSCLPQKARFWMLLNYLTYFYQAKDKLADNVNPQNVNIEHIRSHEPKVLAAAIFDVHRDLFLNLQAKYIAIKYCRGDTQTDLGQFLDRFRRLNNLVSYSIVKKPNQAADEVKYWKKVANKLLKLGDLFGAWGIITGLRTHQVSKIINIDFSEIIDLDKYNIYVSTKNEKLSSNEPIIPSIIKEGSRLFSFFEGIGLLAPNEIFDLDKGNLSGAIDIFILDFTAMQKRLRELTPPKKKNDLYDYFYHLADYKVEENAVELLLLHSTRTLPVRNFKPVPSIGAEYWDPSDLYEWINSENLHSFTKTLIKHKITDGRTFLEQYVKARSHLYRQTHNDLHAIFSIYDSWCSVNNKKALGDFPLCHLFPVNLWENQQSNFYWVMWLRNKGLSSYIQLLLKHNMDNFISFFNARQNAKDKDDFYRDISINNASDIYKFEHLKDVFMALDDRPDDILQWQLIDVEAWLFQYGFSYLIPLIKDDNAWSSDSFLALFYFFQAFHLPALERAGINIKWAEPIFNALNSHYSMVSILANSLPIEKDIDLVNKSQKKSRLFFIQLLENMNAIDLLPTLYNDKKYTLSDLKSLLISKKNTVLRPIKLDEVRIQIKAGVLDLVRYGFHKEQIEKLTSYFNVKFSS